MGGIPNQKDAAHPISLRLTAVDTVVHLPDGITQHATRRSDIEYRLEVLEGWLPVRRMMSLGWANIGSDGSASSRQREKGEHTLGSEEKGELIPRQLPVNLGVISGVEPRKHSSRSSPGSGFAGPRTGS